MKNNWYLVLGVVGIDAATAEVWTPKLVTVEASDIVSAMGKAEDSVVGYLPMGGLPAIHVQHYIRRLAELRNSPNAKPDEQGFIALGFQGDEPQARNLLAATILAADELAASALLTKHIPTFKTVGMLTEPMLARCQACLQEVKTRAVPAANNDAMVLEIA